MIRKPNILTPLLLLCMLFTCTTLAAKQKEKTSSFADQVETKRAFMAVSTNTLYDAALVPNLGFEFNLVDNWTLSVNGMWAWWTLPENHIYWRVYGGDVTARKYRTPPRSIRPGSFLRP